MRMYPENVLIGNENINAGATAVYDIEIGDKEHFAIYVLPTLAIAGATVAIDYAEGFKDEKGVVQYTAYTAGLAATAVTTLVPIGTALTLKMCQWVRIKISVAVQNIAPAKTYLCTRKGR